MEYKSGDWVYLIQRKEADGVQAIWLAVVKMEGSLKGSHYPTEVIGKIKRRYKVRYDTRVDERDMPLLEDVIERMIYLIQQT